MKRALLVLGVLGGLAACERGTSAPIGLFEPIRVRDAFFKPGALPGSVRLDGGVEIPDGGGGLRITSIELTGLAPQGSAERVLAGRVSPGAVALGVRLAGSGTGYWVLPVGAPDPANGNEPTWRISVDLSDQAPSGNQNLQLVPIDANGAGGEISEYQLCVASALPDNLASCGSRRAPPSHVWTLEWDGAADLDLVIVTPSGKTVSAKRPTTAVAPDGGSIGRDQLSDPNTGRIELDSLAFCHDDGLRRETFVAQGDLEEGTYLVYANLFDSCAKADVRYRFTQYRRGPEQPDGGPATELVEVSRANGILFRLAANGGTRNGTLSAVIDL